MRILDTEIAKQIAESTARIKQIGVGRNRAERILINTCLDIIVAAQTFADKMAVARDEDRGRLYESGIAELARIDAYLFAVELYREVASDA